MRELISSGDPVHCFSSPLKLFHLFRTRGHCGSSRTTRQNSGRRTNGRSSHSPRSYHHHLNHRLYHHIYHSLSFFVEQVEDFWALYNHIELASRLAAGCDYSLFKVSDFRHAVWQGDKEEKEHHENIIGHEKLKVTK